MDRNLKIFLIAALCLLFGQLEGSRCADAAAKETLRNKIQAETSLSISQEYYADYDGDGVKELFAVTGTKYAPNEIWFVGKSQLKRIYYDDLAVYKNSGEICKVSRKQKVLVLETGAYGSSSISVCFYVVNGRVKKVKHAGEQLHHLSGKQFVVHQSAFDAVSDGMGGTCGHTWKAYYLRWTGSGFAEYKGKEISSAKLRTYKGAAKYIKKIKKLGYRIRKIYYRKNGIINVNLSLKSGKTIFYENVTFRLKGKRVVLKKNDKRGKNIVEKSSYGGIYRAKGF